MNFIEGTPDALKHPKALIEELANDQKVQVLAIPYSGSADPLAVVGNMGPGDRSQMSPEEIFDTLDDQLTHMSLYTALATIAACGFHQLLREHNSNQDNPVLCLGEYTFGQNNASTGQKMAQLCFKNGTPASTPESRDLQETKGQLRAANEESSPDDLLLAVGLTFHGQRIYREAKKANIDPDRIRIASAESILDIVAPHNPHLTPYYDLAKQHLPDFHGREKQLGLFSLLNLDDIAIRAFKMNKERQGLPRTAGGVDQLIKQSSQSGTQYQLEREAAEDWVHAMGQIKAFYNSELTSNQLGELASRLIEEGYDGEVILEKASI